MSTSFYWPILQMRKLKCREVKSLGQGHTAVQGETSLYAQVVAPGPVLLVTALPGCEQ